MTRRECTKSTMPVQSTNRKVSVSTPLAFWLTMDMIYAWRKALYSYHAPILILVLIYLSQLTDKVGGRDGVG